MAKKGTSKAKLRRELFIAEYLVSLNATKAAIAAGLSPKTARSQGQRMLTNVDVAVEIAKRAGSRLNKLEVSADRVIQEVAKLAHTGMSRFAKKTEDGDLYLDFSEATEDEIDAITELTVEEYTEGRGKRPCEACAGKECVKCGGTGKVSNARAIKRNKIKLDRRASLELLGRYNKLKLWSDRVEIGGDDQILKALADGRRRAAAHAG